jgi:hypothetical protein
MPAALALAATVLQALPTLEVGVEEAIALVTSIRASAQQSGEWTDAQETAFQQSIIAAAKDPEQQQ